jgi:hypothetical protein
MIRCAVLLALLAACAKKAEKPELAPGEPPHMEAAEQERGKQICDGYVARLCGCAASDTSLKAQCDLAQGQPQALALHLGMLNGANGPLDDEDRRLAQANARKVIKACVESDARLPASCPRAAR